MNKRIREFREKLKLSRAAFGKRIGVSGDVINNLERGRVEIKEPMIKLICQEFNISYLWLTKGIEPMYQEEDSYLMTRIDDLMTGENEFAKTVFKEFAKLDKSEWELLEKIIKNISNKI